MNKWLLWIVMASSTVSFLKANLINSLQNLEASLQSLQQKLTLTEPRGSTILPVQIPSKPPVPPIKPTQPIIPSTQHKPESTRYDEPSRVLPKSHMAVNFDYYKEQIKTNKDRVTQIRYGIIEINTTLQALLNEILTEETNLLNKYEAFQPQLNTFLDNVDKNSEDILSSYYPVAEFLKKHDIINELKDALKKLHTDSDTVINDLEINDWQVLRDVLIDLKQFITNVYEEISNAIDDNKFGLKTIRLNVSEYQQKNAFKILKPYVDYLKEQYVDNKEKCKGYIDENRELKSIPEIVCLINKIIADYDNEYGKL